MLHLARKGTQENLTPLILISISQRNNEIIIINNDNNYSSSNASSIARSFDQNELFLINLSQRTNVNDSMLLFGETNNEINNDNFSARNNEDDLSKAPMPLKF